MKQLNLNTEIHYFDTFDEFAAGFSIGKRDLVFTRKAFKKYFEKLENKPIFIFNDDFGKGEPTDSIIDSIVKAASSVDFDRVIAVGGGSVVDIGKLLALRNVTSAKELFLKSIPAEKDKKLVIVPTTCGTGSEVTNISITAVESMDTKLGLADDALFADCAVLVPELLQGLPYKVIMNSSIDALVHASESFLSPKATRMSRMYSIEAIKTIMGVYSKIKKHGEAAARDNIKDLLFASTYAGIAFGLAGTAIVHAMAYPLGSVCHVPHGEANYQFFTECFKFYMERKPEGDITEISYIMGNILGCDSKDAFNALEEMLNSIFPKASLSSYGMKPEDCRGFAESVIKNQQRLLVNSYVALLPEEIENIYKVRYQ